MQPTSSTRRAFLASGAFLAAGAARVPGANSRINVGVIGTGGRGTYLLEMTLKRAAARADVQVVAVSDVYRKRMEHAASLAPGANMSLEFEEITGRRDIDAVIVATPDHWHAPITLAAMESGKDVYCEKPITLTVEEALVVTRKAEQLKRILQVGVQSMSWSKWHRAKDLIASGTLGQVVSCHGTYSRNTPEGDWNWPIDPDAGPSAARSNFIDWKRWLGPAPKRPFDADRFFRFRKYWDYSGGIATDLHYHTVAPFHLAVHNEYPSRVVGMGGIWRHQDGREVPDTFLNSADYPGKWSVLVQSSQANAHGPQAMIRGEKATLLVGDDWEGRELDTMRVVAEKPFRDEFRKRHGKDELVISGAGNEGDEKHIDDFFECVRSRRQPNCNADVAAKVMVHIGLAVRSYREGRMFHFDERKGRVLDRPAS